MKDFSHCAGTNCTRKQECLRFTTPDKQKNQAYLMMAVAIPLVDKCKFYLTSLEQLLQFPYEIKHTGNYYEHW